MQTVNSKYLRVSEIWLVGADKPIRDVLVYMHTQFLIVFKDEYDTTPNWYNLDAVEKMTGVEAYKTTQTRKVIL